MKKYSIISSRVSLTVILIITATLLFSFLPKSAEMKSDSNIAGQQVISPLKRLAVGRSNRFTGGFSNVLFAFNADGTGGQGLSDFDLAQYLEPTWSPDGTKIAYVSNFGNYNIHMVNANGGDSIFLTNTMGVQERNPSWSVTGKIIYERDDEIWTMNSDGTDQVLFSGISQPSPKAPKWSPDGSKIAFTSGGEIWVLNADGTNERRVTNNSTDDKEPDWSPDGTKLVYQKGETGIAVINLDGTEETNLTDGVDDRTPAWSNDNTKIAFIRRGTQENGLFIMDINGENQVRLIADTFQGFSGTLTLDLAWRRVDLQPNTFTISGRISEDNANLSGATVSLSGSATAQTTTDAIGNYQFSNLPSGGNYTIKPLDSDLIFTPRSRIFNNLNNDWIADFTSTLLCADETCIANGEIVFARINPRVQFSGQLLTVNPDGSNLTPLTFFADSRPRYSADGLQIVFYRTVGPSEREQEIFKMNADGTAIMRLTNNFEVDISPCFSPDGQSIVFQSSRDGNREIYKMNADGTNQINLTKNSSNDTLPTYSPDGKKIIFASTRDTSGGEQKLYLMNSDGTNQEEMPAPEGYYTAASYSPDGTKIIVGYGTSEFPKTIHTMNSDGTNFSDTSVQTTSRPSYSPDGRKVIYSGGSSIIIIDADFNSDPLIIGESLYIYSHPDWRPKIIENNVPPNRVPFDFDGDRKSDVGVFRPSENKWYISQSSDSQVTQKVFAIGGDIPTPADFDGDGKTDLAIFRPSTGSWWYLSSADNTQKTAQFGANGDIPLPSDVDGDGVADFVIFRPSNNTWYRSTSNTANVSTVIFGASGDKPVIGDFDGDGESDPAIYRPSTGQWWYQSSVDNSQRVTNWGISTDIPVPSDYDGDGITDFAVYRPSNGGWYILNSSSGQPTILGFGISTDIPIAADYDGDGKTDIAVFRPSTGIWYLQQTTNGFAGLQFGVETDKPIPSAFVQ